MSDDDNYTIEDDDEAPRDAEAAEPENGSVARNTGAIAMLVLGLLTMVGAGLCATVQTGFQEGLPDKTAFFVGALGLPLSIAGALLTVVAVCILVLGLRLPRGNE